MGTFCIVGCFESFFYLLFLCLSFVGKPKDVDVSSQSLVDTGSEKVDVGVGASQKSDENSKRTVDDNVGCDNNDDDVPSKSSEALNKKQEGIVDSVVMSCYLFVTFLDFVCTFCTVSGYFLYSGLFMYVFVYSLFFFV